MVFRDSLPTLAVLVFLAGLFANMSMVIILFIRGLALPYMASFFTNHAPHDPQWVASDLLITGFLATILFRVLARSWLAYCFKSLRLWAFDPTRSHGPAGSH